MANGWATGQSLEGKRLENWGQGNLAARHKNEQVEVGIMHAGLCITDECHQKASTMEEAPCRLNDWPAKDIQPRPSATPVPIMWAHEQSGHSGRDGSPDWA